jgi:hypothetical protein
VERSATAIKLNIKTRLNQKVSYVFSPLYNTLCEMFAILDGIYLKQTHCQLAVKTGLLLLILFENYV